MGLKPAKNRSIVEIVALLNVCLGRNRESLLPLGVVLLREIGAKMDPARFFSPQGRLDNDPGNGEHILQFPALGALKLPRQGVLAPLVDRLSCVLQLLTLASYPGCTPHQALERIANVYQIQGLVVSDDRGIFEGDRLIGVRGFKSRRRCRFAGMGSID